MAARALNLYRSLIARKKVEAIVRQTHLVGYLNADHPSESDGLDGNVVPGLTILMERSRKIRFRKIQVFEIHQEEPVLGNEFSLFVHF